MRDHLATDEDRRAVPQEPGIRLPARPWVPYVLPFLVFLAFLLLDRTTGDGVLLYPVRVIVVGLALILVSRRVISFRVVRPAGSLLLGIAVYAVWVLPDTLWPGYRSHWLFENAIMGAAASSLPSQARADLAFIVFRTLGCVAIVPLVEELFWRGWLGRWLVNSDFEKVSLGAYTRSAFWLSAFLFASEHGPYWEVGLLAGIAYNWWLMRTRNLADCVLAHAVTNACLSAHVLITGQWQYWL